METRSLSAKRRKKKTVDEEMEDSYDPSQPTTIQHMPKEVMQEILVRLPITSIPQSRYVCRKWRRLINDPDFTKLRLTRSNIGLVIQSFGSPSTPRDVCLVPDSKSCDELVKLKRLPFYCPRLDLVGSCNGLVCFAATQLKVSKDCTNTFVCNPVTGEFTEIPESPKLFQCGFYRIRCGFGFDSKSNKYKVVYLGNTSRRIKREKRWCFKVGVNILGTDSWKLIQCPDIICYLEEESGYSAALVNKTLHWIGVIRPIEEIHERQAVKILAFSLFDEQVKYLSPPPPCIKLEAYTGQYYLGNLGGHLIMVDHNIPEYVDVWVMKEHGVNESWSKDFVIYRPRVAELYTHRSFRSLFMLEDGQILVECSHATLHLYDPKTSSYKDVKITGLPISFKATPHQGAFLPLEYKLGDGNFEMCLEGESSFVQQPVSMSSDITFSLCL